MRNEIVVHIGMPKTGTSSLQRFLAYNNDSLQEQGYCYPDTRQNFNNSTLKNDERWKNGGQIPFEKWVAKNDENWKMVFEKFIGILSKNLEKYNVILSSEDIWTVESGIEYLRYLKKTYIALRVIVYLRRQDMWIESFHAELIKQIKRPHGIDRQDSIKKLKEYYTQVLSDSKDGYCYYYDRLKEIENIVGKENLLICTYEEAKDEGLFKNFIQNIGLQYEGFKNIENTNKSFDVVDTEVKRRLNIAFLNESDPIIEQIDKNYSGLHMHFDKNGGYLLSSEERSKILDFFAEDNRKVAEYYFQRKQLFSEEINYPQVFINETDVLDNYTKILEKIIVRMCYQIKYPSLVKELEKGKKIAFFGAGFMAERIIKSFHYPAEIILDNNKEKSGQIFNGIKIVWTGDFYNWDKYIILITVLENEKIVNQLQEYGLKKDIDFFNIHTMGLW